MSALRLQKVSYREQALRSLDQLPPFSPVLNKLLASLADEDVSFAQLAGLIERDTVLSANVLRLVNSAVYGRRGTISSITHAISLVGLGKLRNAVLSLSIAHMWKKARTPEGWSSLRFNLHALATAVLADHLAQHIEVEYAEGAFVGGLLHDMGRLLIAIAFPAEYEEIRELAAEGGRSLCECEREILEITHGELSASALARWNLPQEVVRAVEFHHQPDRLSGAGGRPHLAHLINAADRCSKTMDITIDPAEHAPGDPSALLSEFGLEDTVVERILASFNTEFDTIRQSF
ncbi:MAG: HDOD domain-containing protein [Bryobacteraceae bacterium]|nr:HDOD domain-containing protein [Bryobacteraceae bacterium]